MTTTDAFFLLLFILATIILSVTAYDMAYQAEVNHGLTMEVLQDCREMLEENERIYGYRGQGIKPGI